MAKFFAQMKMFAGEGEDMTKLEEMQHTVTETAPGFFPKMVGRKVIDHRRADNLNKLHPPTLIQLQFSVSEGGGGWAQSIRPENMTRKEVEHEIAEYLDDYFEKLEPRRFSID